MASQYSHAEAGPAVEDLFCLQSTHIALAQCTNDPRYAQYKDRTITCRAAGGKMETPHPTMEPYIRAAGFWGVTRVHFRNSGGALTALVDRWRPETHTFLFPFGEATITLEDVEMLLGLSADGYAVVGPAVECQYDGIVLCQELLGKAPTKEDMHGTEVSLEWLRSEFNHTSVADFESSGQEEHMRYARAYILRLLGGVLFVNQRSSTVPTMYLHLLRNFQRCGQYSWRSAVLAYTYRSLCMATQIDKKKMSGCGRLITAWAYARFPGFFNKKFPPAPEGEPYARRWNNKLTNHDAAMTRLLFDSISITPSENQWIWQPYGPASNERRKYMVVTFIVHYNCIEAHQPDRVVRQFGYDQWIPIQPLNCDMLHSVSRTGRVLTNWEEVAAPYVLYWAERDQCRIPDQHLTPSVQLGRDSAYMQWYSRMTINWYTNEGRRNVMLAHGIDCLNRVPQDQQTRDYAYQLSQEAQTQQYHRYGVEHENTNVQAPDQYTYEHPQLSFNERRRSGVVRNIPHSQRRRLPSWAQYQEQQDPEPEQEPQYIPLHQEPQVSAPAYQQSAQPQFEDGYRPIIGSSTYDHTTFNQQDNQIQQDYNQTQQSSTAWLETLFCTAGLSSPSTHMPSAAGATDLFTVSNARGDPSGWGGIQSLLSAGPSQPAYMDTQWGTQPSQTEYGGSSHLTPPPPPPESADPLTVDDFEDDDTSDEEPQLAPRSRRHPVMQLRNPSKMKGKQIYSP